MVLHHPQVDFSAASVYVFCAFPLPIYPLATHRTIQRFLPLTGITGTHWFRTKTKPQFAKESTAGQSTESKILLKSATQECPPPGHRISRMRMPQLAWQ